MNSRRLIASPEAQEDIIPTYSSTRKGGTCRQLCPLSGHKRTFAAQKDMSLYPKSGHVQPICAMRLRSAAAKLHA